MKLFAMVLGYRLGQALAEDKTAAWVRRIVHVGRGRPILYRAHIDGGVLVERNRTLIEECTIRNASVGVYAPGGDWSS